MKSKYKGGIKARILMIGWFLFMAAWSIFTPKQGAEIIEAWIDKRNNSTTGNS